MTIAIPKLTTAQMKVLQEFENAVYIYKDGGKPINLYVNGSPYNLKKDSNGEIINCARIVGVNTFYHKLSTVVIKSLAKKGFINLDDSIINGKGFDTLVMNHDYTFENPLSEVSKLELEHCIVYCPIGQEKETLEKFNGYDLISTSKVKLDPIAF